MTLLRDKLEQALEASDLEYGDLARILDSNPRTVQRWFSEGREPRWESQERLLEVAVVIERLLTVVRPNAAREWLFAPNRSLHYEKPAELLREGKYREVLAVIDALGEGVFT
jgi:uncharacterized protein (DUF2384 family)